MDHAIITQEDSKLNFLNKEGDKILTKVKSIMQSPIENDKDKLLLELN